MPTLSRFVISVAMGPFSTSIPMAREVSLRYLIEN
jgi:hypothetical protein